VRARAELVANPLPPQAMALIAKWDYSPPDEESPNAGIQATAYGRACIGLL
jgi:hypothetical protein